MGLNSTLKVYDRFLYLTKFYNFLNTLTYFYLKNYFITSFQAPGIIPPFLSDLSCAVLNANDQLIMSQEQFNVLIKIVI